MGRQAARTVDSIAARLVKVPFWLAHETWLLCLVSGLALCFVTLAFALQNFGLEEDCWLAEQLHSRLRICMKRTSECLLLPESHVPNAADVLKGLDYMFLAADGGESQRWPKLSYAEVSLEIMMTTKICAFVLEAQKTIVSSARKKNR